MDDLSSIYSEKKLAHFETSYRENLLAKPQDVNVSITAAHIYGLAFICDQVGTKEGDPEYTRFSCGLEEVTKVYINNNNRNSPIYIQCDDTSKSVMNRRRIILPCFNNNEEIVKIIESAKADFDKKAEKQKENEKNKKLKAVEEAKAAEAAKTAESAEAAKAAERERLKKAADAEFEALTAGYEKPAPKPAAVPDFSVADMLGIEDITGVAPVEPKVIEETKADFEEVVLPTADDLPTYDEVKPVDPNAPSIEELSFDSVKAPAEEAVAEKSEEPKPAPVIEEAPKPAPAPAPAPVEAPKPAPAPAPAPKEEPKPAPAPAPKEEPKPAPAPAPKAEPKPAPAPAPVPAPKPVVEEIKAELVKEVPKAAAVTGVEEYKSMSLEEFQTAVMKLKAMLDSGVMTSEEFAAEKAKLLKCLY